MRYSDTVLIPAVIEPMHLTEVRAHLRAPSGQTGQDPAYKGMLAAARRRVEDVYGLALVRQQRLLAMPCFPAEIEIPVGPLRAVQSIQYVDQAGALQTLAASAYRVDKLSRRGRIEPAYGTVWPSTLEVSNAVLVKYTAGYVVPITAFDTTAESFTARGHDLATDDPIVFSNSGGAIQSGLLTTLNYYAIAVDANTLKASASEGGSAVDITTATADTGQSYVGVVPEDIASAMKLIIGHLDQHREEGADFEVFEMPLNAETLLRPYKVMRL